MKVLSPDYNGSVTIYTRDHSDEVDYLFVLFDEETNDAYSYKIDSTGITYDGYKSTFTVDLPIQLKKFYNYQLFTQDGSVTDSTSESNDMYETIYSMNQAGRITGEIANGKIFCTDQTDLERYEMQKGEYTANETDNEYIIVS